MEAFQMRVVEEKEQLDEKLRRLETFINGELFPRLPATEQTRMKSQRYFMSGYSDVLNQRIQAFDETPD